MKRQPPKDAIEQANALGASSSPLEPRFAAGIDPLQGRSKKLQAQLEICLANPDRLLFLDIETTGLSHYYDDITIMGWAIGGRGETIICGSDIRRLYDAASSAIGLVTFNGLRFDTKFISRDYPDIVLPDLHIDLMYLCRRVGLKGGQKAIEQELDIDVRKNLEDIEGFHAVLLWHQYIRGNVDSLLRLIAYNRADIAAMGAIFDECIERLRVQPTLFDKKVSFFQWSSPDDWQTMPWNNTIPRRLISERATFGTLFDDKAVSGIRVVGIDLTGSEKRKSGWCLLEGKTCKVASLRLNRELLDWTVRESPDLVSIDSPLCLPVGRISARDDDPGRERYGIMRECERELKRRGINVYPSLIPSMQRLTERGIYLANEFRERGIAVIESYPGAAQDIMKIPRKGAGKEFLKLGLKEFGVLEEDELESASHDELDAITSALVGVFHWVGMSELLGTEEEEPLVIPCTQPRPLCSVIGISGPIAAGKTTFARALEQLGFRYTRFSLAIDEMLQEEGVTPTRSTRQALGQKINASGRQRELCRRTLAHTGNATTIVVDGLRFLQDRAWMVERFGAAFTHVHIDADFSTRRSRFEDLNLNGSFSDAAEAPVEREVEALAGFAHHVFSNQNEVAVLHDYVSKLSDVLHWEG